MSDDTKTLDLILKSAEAEFLEKGFQNASLRNIAKNAGVTTGAFYRYYSSKEALFAALVEPHAAYIKHLFFHTIENWDEQSSEEKAEHLTEFSEPCAEQILDYIYEHYNHFKLLICASGGTIYENFIHDLAEEEAASSLRLAQVLREMGNDIPELDTTLVHMISSAMFSGIFEIVVHDMQKEAAKQRVHQFMRFFTGGWSRLMNFDFD